MLRQRSQMKSLAALFLLGVMWLGSACHLRHHLSDPLCGTSGDHGSEPCARCAGLHSAVVVTETDVFVAPSPVVIAEVQAIDAGRPSAPALFGGDPRAPPAA